MRKTPRGNGDGEEDREKKSQNKTEAAAKETHFIARIDFFFVKA